MRRLWRYDVLLLLLILQFAVVMYAHALDEKGQAAIKRWVSGTVVAVNTNAIPNTIVITSKTWKGQDITVGAQVNSDTEITVDGKHAVLSEVVQGDDVSMHYLREPLALIAKSIRIKRAK
ncbi:MAG: hypothetical protein HZA08_01675 [Nitrospirae bacterium]|nr:hypothetical protein [Nitrospirota bacterium]